MSELDEARRRAAAAAEANPEPPPQLPTPPAVVDGQSHTSRPQNSEVEAANDGHDERGTTASTGRPTAGHDTANLPELPGHFGAGTSDATTGTTGTTAGSETREVPSGVAEGHDNRAANAVEPQAAAVGDQPAQIAPAAEVPRFNAREMQPTGRTDPLYSEQLYLGPDGKEHFDGDPLDTKRNSQGRLITPDGKYAPEPNPRPTDDLEERAQRDLPTRREHTPKQGASDADNAVTESVKERDDTVDRRDAAWTKIEAIANKLGDQGVTVDKSSARNDNKELEIRAKPYLSAAERLELKTGLKELAHLNQEIKHKSEQLGTAGGTLAIAREHPTAVTVTGGTSERGTPGNFDRIVMIDERNKAIIIVEEKGVGSGLGSRLAPDTSKPDGRNIRAEQGSTSYLRHILQTDNKLAAALDRNPGLRQKMQAIINGSGQVKYVLARTSSKGIVTVTDFKIDAGRLRRASIKLPSRKTGA